MKNNLEKKEQTKTPVKKSEQTGLAPPGFAPFSQISPFGLMRRFTEDFERMFDDFNRFRLMPRSMFTLELPDLPDSTEFLWAPQIEILDNNGEFKVRADLPGMKKEDINVELKDHAVVISGERKAENKEEREGFFRSERSYGSFYRQIPLPEGADINAANAVFKDGVLEISVAAPKKETNNRKLEITESKAVSRSAKA
jgi:HSP20 family protein